MVEIEMSEAEARRIKHVAPVREAFLRGLAVDLDKRYGLHVRSVTVSADEPRSAIQEALETGRSVARVAYERG